MSLLGRTAPFILTKPVMAGMTARRWGRIINMSFNYGQTTTVNRVDYCATKAGIVGLTSGVGLEGLPFGATCNAICPAERQPSRRFVEPADVAELIHFLCGHAAREMTGTPISIDGGWLAI